ncbi:hypothetical protein PVL29_018516 [Vitis rotundifolia]|uniref:Uncharacterized protein n=1 Tax=Vitis rotundifolia TaxID=103349 RepID=A0AA38Z577_VITRO|nr:hypothetical protein PVL29_018516 [Vitis rotundifolia]
MDLHKLLWINLVLFLLLVVMGTKLEHAISHLANGTVSSTNEIKTSPEDNDIDGILETTRSEFSLVNRKILEHAPCTIGILVDYNLGGTAKLATQLFVSYTHAQESCTHGHPSTPTKPTSLTTYRLPHPPPFIPHSFIFYYPMRMQFTCMTP